VDSAGLHHVAICVDDLEAALAFYTGTLGLAVRDGRPDLAVAGFWLQAGDQQVHLIEGKPEPRGGYHFALQVEDIDASVAELRGMGVQVTDPVPIAADRQCFLLDPAGNQIELHQVG
jgi:catechol 2,3-dioxygenase-like lactoylglutathione lyase family enzyme